MYACMYVCMYVCVRTHNKRGKLRIGKPYRPLVTLCADEAMGSGLGNLGGNALAAVSRRNLRVSGLGACDA